MAGSHPGDSFPLTPLWRRRPIASEPLGTGSNVPLERGATRRSQRCSPQHRLAIAAAGGAALSPGLSTLRGSRDRLLLLWQAVARGDTTAARGGLEREAARARLPTSCRRPTYRSSTPFSRWRSTTPAARRHRRSRGHRAARARCSPNDEPFPAALPRVLLFRAVPRRARTPTQGRSGHQRECSGRKPIRSFARLPMVPASRQHLAPRARALTKFWSGFPGVPHLNGGHDACSPLFRRCRRDHGDRDRSHRVTWAGAAPVPRAADAIRHGDGPDSVRSERAPIFFPGTQKEVYPPGARSLRIAAPLKRDSGAAGRVIARISTATGYPRLGIAAGANYLWQEVDSAGVRFLVIPRIPERPLNGSRVGSQLHEWPTRMARLVIMEDSIDGKPGTPLPPPPSPTMVASAYICTNDCSSSSVQWCTAKDTLKFHATLTQLTSGLAGGIAGYFARNQVAWPPR